MSVSRGLTSQRKREITDTNFDIAFGFFVQNVKPDNHEELRKSLETSVLPLEEDMRAISGYLGNIAVTEYAVEDLGEQTFTFKFFDKETVRDFITSADWPAGQLLGGLPSTHQQTSTLEKLHGILENAGFDATGIDWYAHGHEDY